MASGQRRIDEDRISAAAEEGAGSGRPQIFRPQGPAAARPQPPTPTRDDQWLINHQRNEIRFLSSRVKELEELQWRLRRRTFILWCAFLLSGLLAVGATGYAVLPLPGPELLAGAPPAPSEVAPVAGLERPDPAAPEAPAAAEDAFERPWSGIEQDEEGIPAMPAERAEIPAPPQGASGTGRQALLAPEAPPAVPAARNGTGEDPGGVEDGASAEPPLPSPAVANGASAGAAGGDPEPAAAAPYVATVAVNLRAGPDNDAPVLAVIAAGEVARRIGDEAGWLQVEYTDPEDGQLIGYVYNTFLRPAEPPADAPRD